MQLNLILNLQYRPVESQESLVIISTSVFENTVQQMLLGDTEEPNCPSSFLWECFGLPSKHRNIGVVVYFFQYIPEPILEG